MNINSKLKPALALLLLGSLAVSCEKEIEDITPAGSATDINALPNSTAGTTSSSVFYYEGMEGSNPFSTAHSIENTGNDYSLSFVTNPAHTGSKSARFELRESDPLVKTGKRTEVTIIKGENLPGKDMWYSYAMYFPTDYAYDSEPEIINQWFQDRSPATALRAEEDRIYLHTGNESEPDNRKKIDLGPVNKGSWNTFVFHFIHSHGSDGLIEVWRNGQKLVTHKGGNMYDVDIMPKFKVGLYKSAFKYGISDVNKRVIYFDDIRVGDAGATFTDMNPGTSTNDPAPDAEDKESDTGEETGDDSNTGDDTNTGDTDENTGSTSGDQVVGFTVINSDTEKDIRTVKQGDVLSLKALGAKKLNFRANTNPSAVGSVKMVMSGADSKTRVDDVLPYALFGDDRKGNYYSWTPKAGTYTITATPYAGDKDKMGVPSGAEYRVTFTITE